MAAVFANHAPRIVPKQPGGTLALSGLHTKAKQWKTPATKCLHDVLGASWCWLFFWPTNITETS
jgi:hypothetical protein